MLSEKIETVLSRSIANTRSRDFHDIYVLYALSKNEIDFPMLKEVLAQTATKSGSVKVLADHKNIVSVIMENLPMRSYWDRYRQDFNYASDIPFESVCNCITEMLDYIYE